MPIGISVDIQDQVTPLIERLGAVGKSQALKKEVAQTGERLFQDHFRRLESERHRTGGTNFYGRAALATTGKATSDGATVSINQRGIAQRVFGGIIRPKEKKALAIPVHPDAYGKRAADPAWGDTLQFIPGNEERGVSIGILVRKQQADDFGTVMYVLRGFVKQDPDPTVLPRDEQVAETAIDTVRRFLERMEARES